MSWDGKYSGTKESEQPLIDDILDAGKGKFCHETDTGGTVRQNDDGIDVYHPSDSKKGHSHDRYDVDTNKGGRIHD